jgi:outer membrane protein assembly factor BamB
MKIDASLRGHLPTMQPPAPFAGADGRRGWKVTLPGNRPLATPAVVDGRVFLGGGFGSYDFYALDARTGAVVWQYQTEDDGPTAAIVADGCVVFNTESCELEVLTVTGERLWKKWLGDPLLSMPAVGAGCIFMAYPDTQGDRRHYLVCFDLRSGEQRWRQPLVGEVITCPVLADGHVYLTNLDGTIACFQQDDGSPLWQEPRNATSSPVVWRRQCYFSQRQEKAVPPGAADPDLLVQQMEHVAFKAAAAGTPTESFAATSTPADYLDHEKRRRRSPVYSEYTEQDTSVGFGSFKGDSKVFQAERNLGHGHVSALWAYQGSKPFVADGKLYSGLGETVHCADPETREVHWQRQLAEGDRRELLDGLLTPPATVNGKLFLGTRDGRLLCLAGDTGETLWSVAIGEPVLFQPAVAQGRVYVPTYRGSLVCVETGDPDDDGWLMWGASAAHNGLGDRESVGEGGRRPKPAATGAAQPALVS